MGNERTSFVGNSTYGTRIHDAQAEDPDIFPDPEDAEGAPETDPSAEKNARIRSSILLSVKDALGLVPEYDPFDNALIMHINTVFALLYQLGVGPTESQFTITGESEIWEDFIADQIDVEFVRSYMFLKVRLLFDPPSTATLYDAYGNQIREMEWRLRVAGDENRLRMGIDELNGEVY